jgi:predicted DNA-binding protein YlxM (UPF0122 family)
MTAAQTKKPTRPRSRQPYKNSKTPAILALATTTNATAPEIADTLKISDQAVYEVLKRYNIIPNNLESYKNHKADILAGIQSNIIETLDKDAIKSMSTRDRVMSYGILFDKEQIARGHSSEGKPLVIINRISVNVDNSVDKSSSQPQVELSTRQVIDITES